MSNQRIYLKETSATSFPNMNYEDPVNNGYTMVYNGPVAAHQGWVSIDITDCNFTGNNNLVVHWENQQTQAFLSDTFTESKLMIIDIQADKVPYLISAVSGRSQSRQAALATCLT